MKNTDSERRTRMKSSSRGPTKFSPRSKTITSALAFTMAIGIWNVIGHTEAKSEQLQDVVPVTELPVVNRLSLPPIEPLTLPAPIPTLTINLSSADMTGSVSGNAFELVMPAMPVQSALPTMEPLPAIPALPPPPPPPASSNNGGNSGSSSQKSGGS